MISSCLLVSKFVLDKAIVLFNSTLHPFASRLSIKWIKEPSPPVISFHSTVPSPRLTADVTKHSEPDKALHAAHFSVMIEPRTLPSLREDMSTLHTSECSWISLMILSVIPRVLSISIRLRPPESPCGIHSLNLIETGYFSVISFIQLSGIVIFRTTSLIYTPTGNTGFKYEYNFLVLKIIPYFIPSKI